MPYFPERFLSLPLPGKISRFPGNFAFLPKQALVGVLIPRLVNGGNYAKLRSALAMALR